MNYHVLREFADSWGLVFMTLTFLVLVGWAFRRGAGPDQAAAARSIFDTIEQKDRTDG